MTKKSKPSVTPKEKQKRPSFFRKYAYELIIALFAFLLYANSIPNNYNLDDELVTRNHRLTSKGISAIPEIFKSFYYQDNMNYAYDYRPLVHVSFAIEHQFFGDNPHVSHFFNVILYSLCCVLLFRFLVKLSVAFSPALSLIITLLFTAHSSHTEVVSSIKNRDEILGLIFCFITALAMLRSINHQSKLLLAAVPFLFFLALISKITFLPFSFILLLSVVLFTQAGLGTIIAISFFLILPAFVLIQYENLLQKLEFVATVPAGAAIMWAGYRTISLVNARKSIKQEVASQLQFYLTHAKATFQMSLKEDTLSTDPLYKKLFRFPPIAAVIVLSAFAALGFEAHNPLLVAIPLLILAGMMLTGNKLFSWWAAFSLFSIFGIFRANTATAINSETYLGTFNAILFPLIVLVVLFYKQQFLLQLVILTSLLLLNLFFPIANGLSQIIYPDFPLSRQGILSATEVICYAIVCISAGAFLTKKKGILLFLIGLIFVYSIIVFGIASGSSRNIFIVSVLLYLLHKYSPIGKYLLLLFLVGVILVIALNQTSLGYVPGLKDQAISLRQNIHVIGKKYSTNISPTKQDRPITFIEQPIANEHDWKLRTGTAMNVLLHYFKQAVIPYPLAYYYGFKTISTEPITAPFPILSLLIHLFLVAIALCLLRKEKILGFGIFVYLLGIISYSNLLINVPGIVADRFLLVASIGWCCLLGGIIILFCKECNTLTVTSFSSAPKRIKYTFGLILGLFSLITFSRNLDWKDHFTLMRHDLKYVDESAQAHNLLALNLMSYSFTQPVPPDQKQLWSEALGHFKKSLEIYSRSFNVAYDIGRVFSLFNTSDSALVYFQKAQDINPSHQLPDLSMQLGNLYQQKGIIDSAIICYLNYVRLAPSSLDGYDKLAAVYYSTGQFQNSLQMSKSALRLIPENFRVYLSIAQTFVKLSHTDSALYYLRKGQMLNPNDPIINKRIEELTHGN